MADQTYALASNGVYGQSSGVYVDDLVTVPSSIVYQYNAQKAFSVSDEGSSTGNWTASVGSEDLFGGTPTVDGSGINGYRALNYDGTDDELGTSFSTVTQPYTIISVVDSPGTSDEGRVYSSNNSADERAILWYSGSNNEWRLNAGATVSGSSDSTSQLITAVYNGSSSLVREDGTQTGSGSVSSNDLVSINVGSEYGTARHYGGQIGLVEVHDKELSSSEITNREQTIANNWGITI